MSKDLTSIMHSQLDEEFAYVYRLVSQQDEPTPEVTPEPEESSMEIESCSDTSCNVDLFADPVYHRAPEAQSSSHAKEQPSGLFQIVSQNLSCPFRSQAVKVDKNPAFLPARTSVASGKKMEAKGKSPQVGKSKKVKKGKREQYPTKNFLPSFRSSFLNYLGKHFEQSRFEAFQIVRRIRGKPCINLQDYQDLFKEQAFEPLLRRYFRNKVIVRDLMQSRIEYSTKCEYFKRIHVFQRAFEKKKFPKINE